MIARVPTENPAECGIKVISALVLGLATCGQDNQGPKARSRAGGSSGPPGAQGSIPRGAHTRPGDGQMSTREPPSDELLRAMHEVGYFPPNTPPTGDPSL